LVCGMPRAGRGIGESAVAVRKMLGYANHLYSEQLGSNGQHLGDFPQAFTQLARINSATYLDRVLSATDDAPWKLSHVHCPSSAESVRRKH